ncbi:MAG: translation initiation factor IF-5A [Nanoarchaeota archaeon]|nr:translation initiation factor IF-5A [Nanoarchaeota archaeon]MBU1135090.1 translation initiation factor IF-5A [Nanoarchaeota archaeon]MBU2519987.1 translation initiation factor IF-5A [Nanoarchaeota archaeon]
MVQAKMLRKNGYCIVDDEPCKVMSIQISKTGRHGHAKARIEVEGLFDGKKRNFFKNGEAEMEVPTIKKGTAQVLSTSGDIAQLMNMEDYSTFEAMIPEEFKDELESGVEVIYWQWENKLAIKGLK